MDKYKFKVGDRVIVHPSADYPEWKGITGTISYMEDGDYTMTLDSKPRGWILDFMSTVDESRNWLRPLKPLSPFEADLIAYIASEKRALGLL